jgi:hypothetical protein
MDSSLKTLVQTKSRHQKALRFKSCLCKSRRGGINIPSYYNRDSKSTKERFELKIYYKKHAKTPKKDLHLQLVQDTIVLHKDGKLINPTSLRHRAISWYHHWDVILHIII